MSEIDHTQAQAALAAAQASAVRVHAEARWMSIYLAVFGIGFAAMALVLGLIQNGPVRIAVFSACWPIIVVGMVMWARRRRATVAGVGRRVVKYWIATAVMYAAVLIVGIPRFVGNVAYWVPAALLIAAPLLWGALQERRR